MLVLVGIGAILFAGLAVHRLVTGASTTRERMFAATAVTSALALAGLVTLTLLIRRGQHYPIHLLKLAMWSALLLIAGISVVAAAATIRGGARLNWSIAPAILGLAGACTCLAWLELAPDPRFATGVLWLTAAVPSAAALSWLWTRRPRVSALLLVVTLAFACSYPAHAIHRAHQFAIVHATTAGGLWNMPKVPTAPTHVIKSVSGTPMRYPDTGDQCWADSLPCSPENDRPWVLRDPGNYGDGFRMTQDLPR